MATGLRVREGINGENTLTAIRYPNLWPHNLYYVKYDFPL